MWNNASLIFISAFFAVFSLNVFAVQPCEEKPYSIFLYKASDLHVSMALPNKFLPIPNYPYFSQVSYIEFNWGSENFYRAGADMTEIAKAAVPAFLLRNPAVVYLRPLALDSQESSGFQKRFGFEIYQLGRMRQNPETIEIKVNRGELEAISAKINAIIHLQNDKVQLISQGQEWGYPGGGLFIRSNRAYQGISQTCNGMVAEILWQTVDNITPFTIYQASALIEHLQNLSKAKIACVKTNYAN
jgi:hypothetical protein